MEHQRPHRIEEIVQAQSSLSALLSTARRLERLRQALGECLGHPLAGQFAVARVDSDALVLVTDSAAWGSRLRYLEQEILDQTRRVLEGARDDDSDGATHAAPTRRRRRGGGRRLQILVRPPDRAGVDSLIGADGARGTHRRGAWRPQPSETGAAVLEQVAGALTEDNPALAAVMRRTATRLRGR